MKTTNNTRFALSLAALLAVGVSANAQNTSYILNSTPIPGPAAAQNVSFGSASMLGVTTAAQNAAVGVRALQNLTTGQQNVAIGWGCLQNNVNGGANTAGGYAALISNVGSGGHTAFGAKAMDVTNGGTQCSGFGIKALTGNAVGNNNTGLGAYANVSAANLNNATAVGANAVVNNNNRVWIGDLTVDVWCATNFWGSDARFKRNISADQVKGLSFIKLLRPVTYNFDGKAFTEHVTSNMPADVRKQYTDRDFSKTYNVLQTGFIAQEVEAAAKQSGYNFSGIHAPEGETDTYGLSYYQFVVPLVKAVQEQQEMIDEQKAINEKMQQQIAELQQQLQRSGTTSIASQNDIANFSMGQNEPNPFTHETVVKYNLPQSIGSAAMNVYDLSGKQIASFPITQKGSASMTITADKLSAGIYIYSIVADGKVVDSKRMIVSEK